MACVIALPVFCQESAHLGRGINLLRRGDFDGAVRELSAATKEAPSYRGFLNLGIALAQSNQPAAAEAAFRRAVSLGTTRPEGHYNLALALLAQNKATDALPELKAAVRLNPLNADMQYNLGTTLLGAGRPKEAMSHLAEAQRLAPNTDTIIQLARAQLAAGQQSEQVIASLDALPPEYRRAPEIRHLIVQAYTSSGRYADALREMSDLRAASPEKASYLLMEAKLRQKVGDPVSALPLLERAERLDAKSAEIPYTAAFSYFVLERNQEAADALTKAISKDPAFGRAYFLRAILELSIGRQAEGAAAMKKALALDPTNVHYRCVYGMGLLSDGRSPEAITEFRRVIKAKPGYALAHYQLGRALAAERRFNDAVPEFESAIRLDPEISEAYYHLARAYQRRWPSAGSDANVRNGEGQKRRSSHRAAGVPACDAARSRQITGGVKRFARNFPFILRS